MIVSIFLELKEHKTVITANTNIELIDMSELADRLVEATSEGTSKQLIRQTDCAENLREARVSLIEDSEGNESALVDLGYHGAHIKVFRPDHVKVAVWMIEESINPSKFWD